MSDQYYDPGTGDYVMLNGNIVERKALYLAEKIKDYDPNLELLCNMDAEGISEEPFVVAEYVEQNGVRVLKPIFRAWELDDRILERIYASDTKRRDVLADIIKSEEQFRADNERRYQEARELNADIVKHIAGMKSKYSITDPNTGELITFYDDRPAVRGRNNGRQHFIKES